MNEERASILDERPDETDLKMKSEMWSEENFVKTEMEERETFGKRTKRKRCLHRNDESEQMFDVSCCDFKNVL